MSDNKLMNSNEKTQQKKLVEEDSDDSKKNSANIKKITGRPNKNKVYVQNRQDVLNKISNIIGFDGVSGIIFLDDITKEKQDKIIDQVDDIKQYFNYANWSYFKKDNVGKTYLMLIRSLYKLMGYEMRQYVSVKKEGDVVKKIGKLSIIKKNKENTKN